MSRSTTCMPSDEEIEYLIARYNRYFRAPISRRDVASTFAGVRPLVGRATNPSAIGRDVARRPRRTTSSTSSAAS